MRLYDRMMSDSFSSPTLPGREREAASFTMRRIGMMSQAVRFDVQNVAEYLFHGSPQEAWSWTEDFHNMAPPFETMWMEYRLPSDVWSEKDGRYKVNTGGLTIGVLIDTEGMTESGCEVNGSLFAYANGFDIPTYIADLRYTTSMLGQVNSIVGVDMRVPIDYLNSNGEGEFMGVGIHSM